MGEVLRLFRSCHASSSSAEFEFTVFEFTRAWNSNRGFLDLVNLPLVVAKNRYSSIHHSRTYKKMTSAGSILPKFEGNTDAEAWIRMVDRQRKLRSWTDEDTKDNTVLNAVCYLDKDAKVWAENVKWDQILEWEEAKAAFLTRWKPSVSRMTVIGSLLQSKKLPKESFQSYADRLRQLSRQSNDIGEEWLIEAFIRGLPPRFHVIGLMKPSTVDGTHPWSLDTVVALSMGLQLTPMEAESGNAASEAPETPSPSTPRPNKYCEHCKTRTHNTTECWSRDKIVTRSMSRMQLQPAAERTAPGSSRKMVNAVEDAQDGGVEDQEGTDVNAVAGTRFTANPNTICFFCTQRGHTAAQCPEMHKSREEYLKRKEAGGGQQ